MTRGADSQVRAGDKVKIIGYGNQVPSWALGMVGIVDRINRQGGIIINLGYEAPKKYITAKRHHITLIGGLKVDPEKKIKFKKHEKCERRA